MTSRREKAKQLTDAGMSQRKAADALGVSHTTVQNDLASLLPNDGNKVATDRDERREAAIIGNETLAARYGHLRVIGAVGRRGLLARCDCGTVRQFAIEALQSGEVASCGECLTSPPRREPERARRPLVDWRPKR
jgi:hypothetical protein